MVELRWAKAPESGEGLAFTFADGVSFVLQYRYRLPRHQGFVMQDGPNTGEPVLASDKWSEWETVAEEVIDPQLPEVA